MRIDTVTYYIALHTKVNINMDVRKYISQKVKS